MTSNSQYLEIEHCHAVCEELRLQLTKAKQEKDALAKEVDEANERVAEVTAERDALAAQVAGLNKANSKLAHKECQQGRINQLEAALDCLQYAAFQLKGVCPNLDKQLKDSLTIHSNISDEMPVSCLAEIRAAAIDSVNTDELFDLIKPIGGKTCGYEVLDWLEKQAAKVRQGGEV